MVYIRLEEFILEYLINEKAVHYEEFFPILLSFIVVLSSFQ